MTRILKYLTALLALWLIVEVSVFRAGPALWIGFATAIAIAAVAAVDAGIGFAQRRWLQPALAVGVVLLAGFLLAATRVFEHASMTWLLAIAGGVIEACALTSIGLPRLHVSALAEKPAGETPRLAA